MEAEPLPLTLLLLVILLVMVGMAVVVVLVSSMAFQRIARERDKLKNAQLEHQRKLLATSLEVQERERKRIAADIHDDLSSKLSVARLALYRDDQDAAQQKHELSVMMDQAINAARDIAYDMYPPLLAEFGLVDTLRDYIRPLKNDCRVELHALHQAASERLDPNVELHLFRIVKELVNNALKHSEASQIDIDLRITPAASTLRVSDNGNGFDTEAARNGWGMQSMESRVQVMGGMHRIAAKPGKGTSALFIIPNPPITNSKS